MLSSGIPAKFPIIWGASAAYINAIPTTSQIGINNGFASLPDGFVPLNQTPVAAGGVPPRIQDLNGILNELSAWSQWYQAGGPLPYDSTFQSAVGGYPGGAVVGSVTTAGTYWRSTADNNTTNPDTGGAGWVNFFAPVFASPTFTGTITMNGPLVMGAGQSASLGALATATTQTQGSNDTRLATDAYVDRQAASTLSTAEGYAASVAYTAQSNAEAYAADQAAAAQAAAVVTSEAYSRALVDGFSAPMSGQTQQVAASGSLTPTLTFTAPRPGIVYAVGMRNNSAQQGSSAAGALTINGVTIMADSTETSMSHSGSLSVSAGSVTVAYATSAANAFSAGVSYLFVPNPPVY